MSDTEFNILWESLVNLNLMVHTVIFNKECETKIRKGIEERYGKIITPDLWLCNIKLVFI